MQQCGWWRIQEGDENGSRKAIREVQVRNEEDLLLSGSCGHRKGGRLGGKVQGIFRRKIGFSDYLVEWGEGHPEKRPGW